MRRMYYLEEVLCVHLGKRPVYIRSLFLINEDCQYFFIRLAVRWVLE